MYHRELLVDVTGEEKGMLSLTEMGNLIPRELSTVFRQIDEVYQADQRQYLTEAVGDVEKIKIYETSKAADCSFIYDADTAKAREALVIFAPFSDVAPKSPVDKLLKFLQLSPDEISIEDRMRAQPHSYNQVVKSKTIHDLLKLEGFGMPVVTIFGLIHPKTYSEKERKRFKEGNFSATTRLVENALSRLEDRLHGTGQNRISKVHFYGPSLGATNGLGAAAKPYHHGNFQVGSFTGQEMLMGPDKFPRIPRLGGRFLFKQQVDGGPRYLPPGTWNRIAEPLLRREFTERGNEPQMLAQMAIAMSRLTFLKGLTRPSFAKEDMWILSNHGIPTTLASAHDSGLSIEAQEFFTSEYTDYRVQNIVVKAVGDQRIGHELNELVTPSATIALAGIAHAAKRH